MTLLWHLAKTDLRRLRWPIALWVVLTALDALLIGAGPLLMEPRTWETSHITETLAGLLAIVRGVLFVVIAALLVHADPLVSADAFWLTRPIPRRTLFASKLLAGALILIVPTLVTEIVLMSVLGVPFADIARVAPEMLLGALLLLLLALYAAGLTANLTQLLLGLVALGLAAWFGLVVFAAMMFERVVDHEPAVPRPDDPTSDVVALAVLVVGFAITISHFYASRRWGRAIAMGIGAIALAIGANAYWPDISFYGGEPQLPASLRDPQVTRLRLTQPIRRVADERWHPSAPRLRQIAAPLVLDGVPDEYDVQAFTVRSSVQPPNGPTLEGRRAHAIGVDLQDTTPRLIPDSSGAISMLPPAGAARREMWPVLFRIPRDALQRTNVSAGTYTGTFQYGFTRTDRLATLPLDGTLRYDDGPRSIVIWTLGERDNGCAVMMRTTSLLSRGAELTRPRIRSLFQERGTQRSLTTQLRQGRFFRPFGHVTGEMGQWFNVTYHRFDIVPLSAGSVPGAASITPDPVSCAAIEVEIERLSFAGRLERSLSIADFHLDPQPGDLTGDRTGDRPRQ